ncbi:uncharacterized protein LOC133522656 [Cydia pomonella]|uniref:uncharacterized protein LOC133522656 n=1 Tax=Cydia pomonella TaxID=82600 RepID=UPI002ADDBA6F|nr:uncharacterized protein LOC133522656 [Cydia pomonella]
MILINFIISSLIDFVIGSCDACVDGHCQTMTVLLQNVDITDQLAMDWTNNILYVQLNSVINTAFYINDYAIAKMHLVQIAETSGMVVRHDTQELYTADSNKNIYKIKKGTNNVVIEYAGLLDGVVNFMFYRNRLYLTKKGEKNIFYFDNTSLIAARDLSNFTITDFVKTDRGVFFVSDDQVYEYKRPFNKPPKVLTAKKMILSTDQFENVYLGSASQKVIYKNNNVTHKIYVYAAYKKGNVDKFVLDRDNNVIAYDATEKSLSIWKEEGSTCTIVLPHCNVQINVHKPPDENDEEEVDEHNDNIVYDFFWKHSEKVFENN